MRHRGYVCAPTDLPQDEPQSLASWALGIVETLEAHGLDRHHVLRQAGLDATALSIPQARLRLSDIGQLWNIAEAEFGSSAGLHVGRKMRVGNWQTLGIGLTTCDNAREWLDRITTYFRLATNGLDVQVGNDTQTSVEISIRFLTPVSHPDIRLDCIVQATLTLIHNLFGIDMRPLLRIELTRPEPANPTPWHEAFGPHIVWSAPVTRAIAPAQILDIQVPKLDPSLSESHRRILETALNQVEQSEIERRIRSLIMHALPAGEPSLQETARRMGLSSRSLQRRLAETGSTYRELLDRVRQQLAENYLCQDFSIGDIAYLLGFSETSNFHAAYKRWTGMTPGEFRNTRQPRDCPPA